MTTILYHQDKLLGDSRRYENVSNNYMVFSKQKVFLHPTKLFAYAVCGDNLPYDDTKFEETVTRFVREMTCDPNFKEMFPYKGIYVLVMMRHITFTIYNNGDVDHSKQYTLHRAECSMGYGSGAQTALMAIAAGATIEEAMNESVLEDMGTGGDLYGVKREALILPPMMSGEGWEETYRKAFETPTKSISLPKENTPSPAFKKIVYHELLRATRQFCGRLSRKNSAKGEHDA